MDPSTPTLLWCSYGPDKYLQETLFSVLTAQREIRREGGGTRVAVVTDAPEVFADWVGDGGVLRRVSAEELQAWRGPEDFLYRIKIEALRETLAELRAPVLLVDGDTYFKRGPRAMLDRLRPGSTLMDRPDGRIFHEPKYAPFAAALRRAYPDLRLPCGPSESIEISPARSVMWIAGTAGLHHEDAGLLEQVLHANDSLLAHGDAFNIEQYAFSEVFASGSTIHPTEDTINHYWGDWVDPEIGFSRRGWAVHQATPVLEQARGQPLERALEVLGDRPITPLKRTPLQRIRGSIRGRLGPLLGRS